MTTRYVYNKQKYNSLHTLRQAIWKNEYKCYGEPKTQEDFDSLDLKVTLEEYDPEQEYYNSLTEEQKAEYALNKAKQERASEVSKITVEVDGMTFDGNEEAQSRMSRTVATAIALGVDINTEKRTWVLADNTLAQPTIVQLAEATKLAGDKMTELWVVPYEKEPHEVSLAKVGIN